MGKLDQTYGDAAAYGEVGYVSVPVSELDPRLLLQSTDLPVIVADTWIIEGSAQDRFTEVMRVDFFWHSGNNS